MIEIKERIKEALQIRGISAAELSRKSGLDKGSISNYLKGKYLPKQSAIGAMASALHVSPAWLMGYDVEMESNDIKPVEPDINAKNNELIALFEKLSPNSQEDLLKYADYLKQREKDK